MNYRPYQLCFSTRTRIFCCHTCYSTKKRISLPHVVQAEITFTINAVVVP